MEAHSQVESLMINLKRLTFNCDKCILCNLFLSLPNIFPNSKVGIKIFTLAFLQIYH